MTTLKGTIVDKGDRPIDQFLTTSVLLIDGSKNQRTYWADQLKSCSSGYEIVEASDSQSGLNLFRSRRIDCVVLELGLPDQSGFHTLVELVPMASRPQVAVIVLTLMSHRGISELATEHGAYACFVKGHTTGEDLDRAIQRAVAFVGQMPKGKISAGLSNHSHQGGSGEFRTGESVGVPTVTGTVTGPLRDEQSSNKPLKLLVAVPRIERGTRGL